MTVNLNELLTIILFFALIVLVIIFIVLGIKLIKTLKKVDKVIEDVNGKMDKVNGVFDIIDKTTDYAATISDKIIGGILEYAKKFSGNIIPYRVEEYLRVRGRGVNRKTLKKIFRTLVDKGYLIENAGYHTGYSIVDMEEFECAYKNGNVINHSPRVKYNIVTFELINKIYAWAKTTKKVKKLF